MRDVITPWWREEWGRPQIRAARTPSVYDEVDDKFNPAKLKIIIEGSNLLSIRPNKPSNTFLEHPTRLRRRPAIVLVQVHPVHHRTGGAGRSLTRPTAAPNRERKVGGNMTESLARQQRRIGSVDQR